jgi:hypothetical protein
VAPVDLGDTHALRLAGYIWSAMPFETEAGTIPSGTVGLVVSRTIRDGIHEDLDLANYGRTPVTVNLEIALRLDFADIFEVKSHKFVRRGRIATEWDEKRQTLRASYANRDVERVFAYRLSDFDPRPCTPMGGSRFRFVSSRAPTGTAAASTRRSGTNATAASRLLRIVETHTYR